MIARVLVWLLAFPAVVIDTTFRGMGAVIYRRSRKKAIAIAKDDPQMEALRDLLNRIAAEGLRQSEQANAAVLALERQGYKINVAIGVSVQWKAPDRRRSDAEIAADLGIKWEG